LDTQVQVKMMELAEKWTDLDTTEYADPVLAIESRVHNFDKIYKALNKTLASWSRKPS